MFFLKDEILDEFIKFADINPSLQKESVSISVNPIKECIVEYIESLTSYLNKPDEIVEGLVKVKCLELLLLVAQSNEQILFQLLQAKRKETISMVQVLEENL